MGPKLSIVSCNRLAKAFLARAFRLETIPKVLIVVNWVFMSAPFLATEPFPFHHALGHLGPPGHQDGSAAIYASPYYWPMSKK